MTFAKSYNPLAKASAKTPMNFGLKRLKTQAIISNTVFIFCRRWKLGKCLKVAKHLNPWTSSLLSMAITGSKIDHIHVQECGMDRTAKYAILALRY